MSRLEEKLKELGYEQDIKTIYVKYVHHFRIFINSHDLKKYGVEHINMYTKQSQIDTLQRVFNVMQKDLEVLKKYE